MNGGVHISPSGLIREAITSHHDRALAALLARTYQSWKLGLDSSHLVGTAPELGSAAVNLFLRQGSGATVTDIDGRTMIDFSMGDGAALLGHDHPDIRDALHAQIAAGWHLGHATALQVDISRLIQAAGPANERIALCVDGNDATLLAMRAARAVTKRDSIGLFTGSRHGRHSYAATVSEMRTNERNGGNLHLGSGSSRATVDALNVLPYGHLAAFDLVRRHRNELAAVIVEPVRNTDPHLDAGPWLQELAEVCRRDGILLIFDEVATGFRLAYGGAQEVLKVEPDLVIYGKAIGGGLPLGAVAGRAPFMRPFGQDMSSQGIVGLGAFSGNTLSVAAGAAFLARVHGERETLYPALNAATARLAKAFNTSAAELGVPATLQHAGSMFLISLGPVKSRRLGPTLLRTAMDSIVVSALNGGVMIHPDLTGFVSAAHTDEQIDQAARVFAGALAEVKADGLFVAMAHN
jgi:glutamate-1-semialdehyde aminotransferase